MNSRIALAVGLVVFFGLMVAIALWAPKRIHPSEDFIVALLQCDTRLLPAIILIYVTTDRLVKILSPAPATAPEFANIRAGHKAADNTHHQ